MQKDNIMKVTVTARNFSTDDDTALKMLKNAGFEVDDRSSEDIGSGTDEKYIRSIIADADAVICGPEKISNRAIVESKNLKIVSRRGVGYDSLDINFCRQKGVAVARALGTVEGSVAESVMAYILYFARRIDLQSESMNRGEWKRIMTPGAKSRTLGLIGFGGIGKEIAKRAVPFGMNVIYYCRRPKDEHGAHYAELNELLRQSDYVSISVPLTKSTASMIDEKAIAKMKDGAVLINTARSGIVDTPALAEALKSGKLSGAAVDVFDNEPCTDSPLIGLPNAVLTPHTAPYTMENFREMNNRAAKSVVEFFNGTLDSRYLIG